MEDKILEFYKEENIKLSEENINLKHELENYKKLPERLDEVLNKLNDLNSVKHLAAELEFPIVFKNGEIIIECNNIKILYNGVPDETKFFINGKECIEEIGLCELDIHISNDSLSTLIGKFALVSNLYRD